MLVGPDNGLLSLAWELAGGPVEAVDISRSKHRLEPVSATFHGRDVFAPVAAALAGDESLAEAGDPLAVDDLAMLELPRPRRERDVVIAHALLVDVYGNVTLEKQGNLDIALLPPRQPKTSLRNLIIPRVGAEYRLADEWIISRFNRTVAEAQ